MLEIRWNWAKWNSMKRNISTQISTKRNLICESISKIINWNLIRCSLNRHEYDKPTKHLTLHRLIMRCPHCGKEIKSPYDYNFVKLQETKFHITNHINNDSFVEAKLMLDDLLRNFE